MRKDKYIGVRVTELEHTLLKSACDRKGKSLSQLTRAHYAKLAAAYIAELKKEICIKPKCGEDIEK